MTYVWMALASAFCLGLYEVARKHAVTDNAPLAVLCLASAGGLGALSLLLLVARYSGQAALWGLELQPLSLREHGLVMCKAGIVSASWVCAYFAVKHLPISLAGPLRAMSPALTLLGAVLLFAEMPSALQWTGIFVLLAGYFGFSVLSRQEGIAWSSNRWVWLLVLGTLIGATSGLYDKHLLQGIALPPTTLQFWFCVYGLILQSVIAYTLWWRRTARTALRFTWTAPLVGVLLMVADQFYFRALHQPGAMVSVISLVRRASVLVSFLLGGWLFREQLLSKKALALCLVIFGLAILVFAR